MARLLLPTLLLLRSACACAWDPFGLKALAREVIVEDGGRLLGTAKDAFEESMQQLFDKDIAPFIDKVDAMINEQEDKLKKDVEDIVSDARNNIKELIDHAASVAQQMINNTIEEIKEKIIDDTFQKIQDAESTFFQGLDGFLGKVYELVNNVSCIVEGEYDKLRRDVYGLIGGKGCLLFPDKCCRQAKVSGKKLIGMSDAQLYDITVCRRTSGIDEQTPLAKIEQAYVDCQIAARSFYCTNFNVANAKDYFTKEYNKWGVEYDAWTYPATDHVGAGLEEVPAQARDPCGTPAECYQQAIQKLDEARAEIKNKADMAWVQSLIENKADMTLVQSLIDLQAEELKVFHGDSCPDGWVESEVTKGYMLVGRPDGGTTKTQLNTPLRDGEGSRVGPHGHGVSVSDPGHGHSIRDPGHKHSFPVHGDRTGYVPGLVWTDEHGRGSTSHETTGITGADSSHTGLQVSVQDSTSEGYPLAYVLICQRAAMRKASGTATLIV